MIDACETDKDMNLDLIRNMKLGETDLHSRRNYSLMQNFLVRKIYNYILLGNEMIMQ